MSMPAWRAASTSSVPFFVVTLVPLMVSVTVSDGGAVVVVVMGRVLCGDDAASRPQEGGERRNPAPVPIRHGAVRSIETHGVPRHHQPRRHRQLRKRFGGGAGGGGEGGRDGVRRRGQRR